MSTFCFVFELQATGFENARSLLVTQSAPEKMREFQERASLVPYETEDMWLGTCQGRSLFVVYVEASQPDMALNAFFDRVRLYKTEWSDWWNVRFQAITNSSIGRCLLADNTGKILFSDRADTSVSALGNVVTTMHLKLLPPVSNTSNETKTIEVLRAMFDELNCDGALRHEWSNWATNMGLVCRVVFIAIRTYDNNESGGHHVHDIPPPSYNQVLVSRSRIKARIEAEAETKIVTGARLAAWRNRYGKSAEEFLGLSIPQEESEAGANSLLHCVFDMTADML